MYENKKYLKEGFNFNKAVEIEHDNVQQSGNDIISTVLIDELLKEGVNFLRNVLTYNLKCTFNRSKLQSFTQDDNINYFMDNQTGFSLVSDNQDVWHEEPATATVLEYYQQFSSEISDHYIKNIRDDDKVYVSNDGGIILIKLHTNWNYIVCYTGKVTYNKKKSKELVNDKIPVYFMEYIFQENIGETVQKLYNEGFAQIPDKNGYPQFITIIRKERSYGWYNKGIYWKMTRFPSLVFDSDKGYYSYPYRENWEKLPDTGKPEIVTTKRSKDGLLMMGAVIPYNFRKIFGNRNWVFYDYKSGDRRIDRDNLIASAILNQRELEEFNKLANENEDYKPEINLVLGIYAYRLTDFGKQLYTQAMETFGNKGAVSKKKIGEWIEQQLENKGDND